MNLQEQTYRIKQIMGINEQHNHSYLFKAGGINWYRVNGDAKNNVKNEIHKEFGQAIPEEVYSNMWKMFPSVDSSFFKSLISDIQQGVLSQKTAIELKNHMTSYLNSLSNNREVSDSIRNANPKGISKIKSPLAKPLVTFYVNKFFNIIVPSYFIDGMVTSINGFSDANTEFKSNSNKLIKQLSSSISNDSKLKETINSAVNSYISKL